MFKFIKNKFFRFTGVVPDSPNQISRTDISNHTLENLLIQNGKIFNELMANKEIKSIQNFEFKIFSQWGDDGIIQFLINYIDIKNRFFIEFGVGDYLESNTRYLLMNNNWSGLIMDSSEINVQKIKKYDFFWKYDLIAKAAFVTSENINPLIAEENLAGEIGLLHIDLDGNDYWIWKALEVVNPVIAIIEYNSVFGADRPITIPYDQGFGRTDSHYSNLYAGSSILSLCDLASEKGYSFIGSNSSGNNAYFVKNQYLKDLVPLSAKEGYVKSKFRESRDMDGKLSYKRDSQRSNVIKGMPVFNTRTNQIEEF